jgi:hypothetical protein
MDAEMRDELRQFMSGLYEIAGQKAPKWTDAELDAALGQGAGAESSGPSQYAALPTFGHDFRPRATPVASPETPNPAPAPALPPAAPVRPAQSSGPQPLVTFKHHGVYARGQQEPVALPKHKALAERVAAHAIAHGEHHVEWEFDHRPGGGLVFGVGDPWGRVTLYRGPPGDERHGGTAAALGRSLASVARGTGAAFNPGSPNHAASMAALAAHHKRAVNSGASYMTADMAPDFLDQLRAIADRHGGGARHVASMIGSLANQYAADQPMTLIP